MSKFWAGSDSDTESDSQYSDDASFEDKPAGLSKYMDSDSDFSDDEVRVVRSAKQKAASSLNALTESIKDGMDDNDYIAISTNFDKLQKEVEKYQKLESLRKWPEPNTATVIALNNFLVEQNQDKANKKKLSKTQTKAFNSLSQKLKKLLKENEKEVKKVEAKGLPEEWGVYDEDEDDDDDDDFDDDDDDDDVEDKLQDSDDDDFQGFQEAKTRKNKWMMNDDKKAASGSKRKPKRDRSKATGDDDSEDTASVTSEQQVEAKWDEARVERTVRELLSRRGLRGTGRTRQIGEWRRLLGHAAELQSPSSELLVLVHTITAEFDSANTMSGPLKASTWHKSASHLARIVTLLEENKDLQLIGDSDQAEGADLALAGLAAGGRKKRALLGASLLQGSDDESSEEDDDEKPEEGDDETMAEQAAQRQAAAQNSDDEGDDAPLQIVGSLAALVERLDTEWRKALQAADAHSLNYVARLRDEGELLALVQRIYQRYTATGSPKLAARLASRLIEHLYWRRYDASLAQRLQAAADKAKASGTDVDLYTTLWLATENHTERIKTLTKHVYKYANERLQTRALLAGVYHDAIHDRYTEARDTLLMSYTQETIHHADIATQVLFNRAMAQVGLAAFRRGDINEAHAALSELYNSGRVKELLAQGSSARYGERTPEQERAEKRRQLPYHMHINLELLEASHLTSALLLEVPNMAQLNDTKRRVISRVFRRQLDYSERQVFSGPPESTRDVSVVAAKALLKGDWRRCADLITGLSVWQQMPRKEAHLVLLRRLIQRAGLRAYLLAHGGAYASVSAAALAKQFDLDESEVHALCSRMQVRDELSASWHQMSACLIMHRVDPTRLQQLSLQLADRAATFVENNERSFDARSGGYGFKDRETQQTTSNRSQRKQRGPRNNNNNSNTRRPFTSGNKRHNKSKQRQ